MYTHTMYIVPSEYLNACVMYMYIHNIITVNTCVCTVSKMSILLYRVLLKEKERKVKSN